MLLRVAHKYWLQEFLYWLYPRVAYCTVLGVMFLWKKMAASDYHPFVFRILKWFGDSCGFDSCKKKFVKNSPLLNNNFKEQHSILWIGKSGLHLFSYLCNKKLFLRDYNVHAILLVYMPLLIVCIAGRLRSLVFNA